MRRLIVLLALPLFAAAPPATFTPHTLASDLRGGYQVVAADLNHDGRPDLIALASGMPELVWFENPGWQRHVLATGVTRMINCVVVGNEIVLAMEFNNQAKNSAGVVGVLRPGSDVTQPWTFTEIDRIPTSHRLRLAHPGGGRTIVINAALTAADTGAPDFRGATPLVYYVPGEWKRREIGTMEGLVHGLFVTDWNGDKRDDILVAGFSGIQLFQAKKDGTWACPRSPRAIRRPGRNQAPAISRSCTWASSAYCRLLSRGMGTRWRCIRSRRDSGRGASSIPRWSMGIPFNRVISIATGTTRSSPDSVGLRTACTYTARTVGSGRAPPWMRAAWVRRPAW